MKKLIAGLICILGASSAFAGDGQDWAKIYKKNSAAVTIKYGDHEFEGESTSRQCESADISKGTLVQCKDSPLIFIQDGIGETSVVSFDKDANQIFVCSREASRQGATPGALIAKCEEWFPSMTLSFNTKKENLEHLSFHGMLTTYMGKYFYRMYKEMGCSKTGEGAYSCGVNDFKANIEFLKNDGKIEEALAHVHDKDGVLYKLALKCFTWSEMIECSQKAPKLTGRD